MTEMASYQSGNAIQIVVSAYLKPRWKCFKNAWVRPMLIPPCPELIEIRKYRRPPSLHGSSGGVFKALEIFA
jgi:hypothetical protein